MKNKEKLEDIRDALIGKLINKRTGVIVDDVSDSNFREDLGLVVSIEVGIPSRDYITDYGSCIIIYMINGERKKLFMPTNRIMDMMARITYP